MISTRISIVYNAKQYYIECHSEGNILYYIVKKLVYFLAEGFQEKNKHFS